MSFLICSLCFVPSVVNGLSVLLFSLKCVCAAVVDFLVLNSLFAIGPGSLAQCWCRIVFLPSCALMSILASLYLVLSDVYVRFVCCTFRFCCDSLLSCVHDIRFAPPLCHHVYSFQLFLPLFICIPCCVIPHMPAV